MSIDWNNLRPLNNSKNDGFEELCCQLAEAESLSGYESFVRKGTPDAGVECYWVHQDGTERAWQAKYFREFLGKQQWNEIDASFRVALAKHPKLTHYYICLPQDLSDGRVKNQKSAKDKWDELVKTWKADARKLGREIEIVFWGQSQLNQRLAKEEHRGLAWFWFNTPAFTNHWFAGQIRDAVANARDRYDPDFHVENAEQQFFDALVRSAPFWQAVGEHVSKARSAANRLFREAISDFDFSPLKNSTAELLSLLDAWLRSTKDSESSRMVRIVPWDDINYHRQQVRDDVEELSSIIRESTRKAAENEAGGTTLIDDRVRPLTSAIWDFQAAMSALGHYLNSPQTECANSAGVLVVGEAGQGKTHTFCRWAQTEHLSGRPVLLLFGEQFQDSEPWSQIISRVGLSCDRDQFLGAIVAAAKAAKKPAVIFIDALNEGDGKKLWIKYLAGMIQRVRELKWIRLCVSVRDSYESLIVPTTAQSELARIQHRGFSGISDTAAAAFFAKYGLRPSAPLMNPEFDNPLFLKLFCEGLKEGGEIDVPKGLRGITAIIRFLLANKNSKLARELDFDPNDNLVERAVHRLSLEMAKSGTDRIPRDDAKNLVNELLPRSSYEQSLFRNLESEAILTSVPLRHRSGPGFSEVVRFTYERFSDHLIAETLIAVERDQIRSVGELASGSRIAALLADESACWERSGLVEALAVQLPETTGKEIFELAKGARGVVSSGRSLTVD
ncbi:hypothetical protein Poly51_62320 [Rubripirellula tenax]|uniref:Uncharacterized protein n=1 Tax=Rubripirellula tenax TaxID=2528015 RepID=A0A5C6E1Z5_9BACT|nr:hypothetical protein [Rubripirellula tenax]TWU43653.1 hypothetical protein Poly51_62320 [Rubripirellula tenax]